MYTSFEREGALAELCSFLADITPIPFSTFGRTYNSTAWANLIWDIDKSYRVAFEGTYRQTEYREPTNLPNKGFGFHTQFQWRF